MNILDGLQQSIEALHDIETNLEVSDYVVDDRIRNTIPGARAGIPEQLFVHQDDDGMEVALYIAPHVVKGLERDNPHRRLHAGNLENYCIALEGVSHFVFVAWCADMERHVSPLELEVQAEVDKFVVAWLLLAQQGTPLKTTAKPLARQLFHHYSLHDDVSDDEVMRYHTANRAAYGYCRGLIERYANDGDTQRIRDDVRSYYRQGLASKLRAM